MPEITFKDARTSYLRQNYDTLAYCNYTTDDLKDNSVTLSLLPIMPQIIYKRVYFPFCFPNSLSIDGSQESCIVA